MKKGMKKRLTNGLLAATLLAAGSAYAGNPQRAGSAGASELLINPWAQTSGWAGANIAGVSGVEASFLNIAGTAQTEVTQVGFSNTQWLVGSDVSINSFGFNQAVGNSGVLGATVNMYDYGEWEITTTDNPDGGIGSISPSTAIIGLSYAQRFTSSILGGVNVKFYSQNSRDLNASALCFDAGVQYITGEQDQIKFGITLQNVGPSASFEGDGKSIVLPVPRGNYTEAFNTKSATFELPATLSIGGSYDFEFTNQKLTLAGAFRSNSFDKDEYMLGAEYTLIEKVTLRAGYVIRDNRDEVIDTDVRSGVSAGLSLKLPLGDSDFRLDYAYQPTDVFDGIHGIGVNFDL